jgi:hypothetical protein
MNSEIYRAVRDIPALDRKDAAALADRIIEGLIDSLRRNPTLPARSYAEWELLFAPTRARAAEQIAATIDGHVDLDEVLTTIVAVW